MNTQALCIPEKLQIPTTKNIEPYVMRGNETEKALDIYHLIFAPSHACNLRCRHCYLPDHDQNLLSKDIALGLIDEWSKIVLHERGRYHGIFHIKGGEPLMVPYLPDLLDRLIELQILRLMITTNGTLSSEDIVKHLAMCNDALNGHVSIIVSLDGATEDTHSILRGKGQLVKTLSFLEELQKYGIAFYLNCVLHSGNIHELSEYIDLAKKYGASQINFLSFVPRGMGSDMRHLQIPHLDVYQRLSSIYENADEATRDLLAGSLPDIKHKEACGQCSISNECVATYRGLLYITPDGSTYSCPNLVASEFYLGNVCHDSLNNISHNLIDLYKKVNPRAGACHCVGEKMLHEKNNDSTSLEMLSELQEKLFKTQHTPDPASLFTSYCFNKNW